MKHLVVAEKPSVGRDIARVLQCKEQKTGYLSGDEYIVTWGIGHLVTNCLPGEINPSWQTWKLEDLPILPDPIPLKVIQETKKQYEIVSGLMNSSDVIDVICATDAGREGELIFRYIYQMAKCTKPVQRLWISSMTPQAIREGFQQLRSSVSYDNLYNSALCRSEADWYIGINASREYSLLGKSKLTVGRVQTPTLKILVDREKERASFVPAQYGTLEVDFGGFSGKWFDPGKKGDESYQFGESQFEDMNRLAESLINTIAEVREFTAEVKTTPAPLLYDLTSLQREANKEFGFSAKKTLEIAQDLYEKRKAITYPRTDSRCLTHDMVGTLKGRLEKLILPEWQEGIKEAKASDKKLFGRFINDSKVSDHHAIIPTGYSCSDDSWSDGEKKLFDLIARRFIEMFLPDKAVEEQVLVAEGTESTFFRATGKRVREQGWERIALNPSEATQCMQEYTTGDKLLIKNAFVKKHETTPPPSYTDASLLYAMEHAGAKILPEDPEATGIGLGTPATRAEIIEKIIKNGYAKRIGKKAIVATNTGIKLIEVLPEKLTSPSMTVDWEKQLAEIGNGSVKADSFMDSIKALTTEIVATAKPPAGPTVLGKCPLCGGNVVEGAKGKNYYCQNKSCDFNAWKSAKGHPFIAPEDMVILLKDGTLKKNQGTITLTNEPPFVQFEKAAFVPVKVDQQELTAFLMSKGITPVNKVPNGGNFWIPGGFDIKPIISETSLTFHVSIGYSKDAKALDHHPGWYIKGGWFVP